jgi:TonB family protein
MRVLVVDQDSASNLAITRSLRDLYTVDCVSNKGDSLDLLRANTYEVIVATERLEDGSGLELLGTVSKKWPSVLRIFAAERQRLQLLRGRLGPFELFQTLAYPIDPHKLIATLEIAAAAQHGEEQQIELTSEAPPEPEAEAAGQADDSLELGQSDEFEEPRFARAGRASGQGQVSSVSQRSSGRGAPPAQTRPPAAQRARSVPATATPPAADSPRGPRARRSAEPNRANELAAKFPGSGTIGPRRAAGAGSLSGPLSGSVGGPARSARPRSAASKAPPVRFPPLERTPPLERVPPLEPPSARNPGGEFSEAAAMARAARSNYESSSDELDTKRLATMIGGGVAVAAVVVFLAFKMFGSKSEAPKPAAPVVAHAPEYPPEVTNLIAQIEAAFKADDFKTARADVDKLRQISPSHPRLDFFDGLLTAKSSTTANGRGAGKKNGKSGGAAVGGSAVASSGAAASGSGASGAGASGSKSATGSASSRDASDTGAATAGGSHAVDAASAAASASTASPTNTSGDTSPGLAPETPVGLTRASVAPSAPASPAAAGTASGGVASAADAATATPATGAATTAPASAQEAAAASASLSAPGSASLPAATAAAETAHSPAQASPAPRRGGGEPPPVVQEAKLVRRVNPDYPSAAKKEGLSGFVELEVTVSKQGNVDGVSVIQSTPPNMFDKSAVAAVRKWKYDPRFVDGLPSQAHLKVHLEFGPNK